MGVGSLGLQRGGTVHVRRDDDSLEKNLINFVNTCSVVLSAMPGLLCLLCCKSENHWTNATEVCCLMAVVEREHASGRFLLVQFPLVCVWVHYRRGVELICHPCEASVLARSSAKTCPAWRFAIGRCGRSLGSDSDGDRLVRSWKAASQCRCWSDCHQLVSFRAAMWMLSSSSLTLAPSSRPFVSLICLARCSGVNKRVVIVPSRKPHWLA